MLTTNIIHNHDETRTIPRFGSTAIQMPGTLFRREKDKRPTVFWYVLPDRQALYINTENNRIKVTRRMSDSIMFAAVVNHSLNLTLSTGA